MAAHITICPESCDGSLRTSACTMSITYAAAFPVTGYRRRFATIMSLMQVSRLTLLQSFRCVRLVLWDEDQRRLVSFQRVRFPEG